MTTDPDRLRLIARTLRVEEARWHKLEKDFAEQCRTTNESVDGRIRVLKQIWASLMPHEAGLDQPLDNDPICPVCKAEAVQVVAVRWRRAGGPLVYGSCGNCDLGILLHGGAKNSIYSQPDYYLRQDDGAGYEDYLSERAYREAKGRRLIEWIQKRIGRPLDNFLEVGSGFGFTRSGAEQLGLETAGVDVNPEAAKIALDLYGQQTFAGTLADAIGSGAAAIGNFDIVCYQFVLEHLANPAGELELAAQTMAPRGVLVLVVPNMRSHEREIFGASYRSFRPDHLWLFSPTSIAILLEQAGLRGVTIESECNIRLLDGFFSAAELFEFDAECRSADLLIIAEKK